MTKEQLGALIIESEDTLYRVARALLRNEADQADAISEAIVKAFASIGTLREERYARTWLIRIVQTECFNIMRKEKRLVSLDTAPETFTESDPDEFRDLYDAMEQLPEKMRVAITLHYMEGYSVREIAEIQEMSESAVKMNLYRGREKLEMALKAPSEQKRSSHEGNVHRISNHNHDSGLQTGRIWRVI